MQSANEIQFISAIKKKVKSILIERSERSVEDIFRNFFADIPNFKASRSNAPRLKFHKTLYTDGIVSFEDSVFSVFEFKKSDIKFLDAANLLFNQKENIIYAQAIKYILCSNSTKFASELKFNKVFIFNGYQIIKISISQNNINKIYQKLNWNEQLNSFLNDQRNLSSFLQNIILSKFNTIKPLINFNIVLNTEGDFDDTKILALYKELTESTEAKISIIRMNLKEKFEEFSNCFSEKKINEESAKYTYLSNLILRIFIEISVHINTGVNCALSRDQKLVNFRVEREDINIYYTEEDDNGEMIDKPITIYKNYLDNIQVLNNFFKNHIIHNLDVLYEDYDNLISDERTRKSIGLYFTKSDLSHLCYEFLTQIIPSEILKTCHFYDPAAGSGNLLKAQEDFSTVIGSDIKKVSQDIMRNRNINVPKKEIDFFQTTRDDMVAELNSIVEKKGKNFIDNPLLIIMNPPYRGKNTWVENGQIGNKIGVSRDNVYLGNEFIKVLRSNKIRSNDLSSFFILKAMTFYLFDRYYGYIATFTPTNWLHSGRGEHNQFRKFVLNNTKFLGGFIINGKKFFDNLNSNLTIAFSVFQFDKEKIDNKKKNQNLFYYDLYKEHSKIKKLFELKQYKHWEPSYTDDSNIKKELKEKYMKLTKKIFNNKNLKNFSNDSVNNKVYFKDIFRAINSQTGDDKKVLLHIENNFQNLDLNKIISDSKISNDDIFIVATDKVAGYDIATRPKERKKRGCVFNIPKSIEGPTIAWHYLWDYLATYPTRFYNAVPITRKYAYTFIDPKPLLNIEDVKNSRSCKTFRFIEESKKTLDYIKKWQDKLGDLRGLFFFFFALTSSDISQNISKNVLYKNSPIWCPLLNNESLEIIKSIIQIGTAYAIFKYNDKFQEFTLSRNNDDITRTINYFDEKSSWFRKSKISETLLNLSKKDLKIAKNIMCKKLNEKDIKILISSLVSKLDSYNQK